MSRRRGNDNENAFCEEAEALGYCTYPARGSRGAVDVVCFAIHCKTREWLAPLVVQVGTAGKPVARTLTELIEAPRPYGSLCIVARRMAKAKTFPFARPWRYTTAHGTFSSLKEAIATRTR